MLLQNICTLLSLIPKKLFVENSQCLKELELELKLKELQVKEKQTASDLELKGWNWSQRNWKCRELCV